MSVFTHVCNTFSWRVHWQSCMEKSAPPTTTCVEYNHVDSTKPIIKTGWLNVVREHNKKNVQNSQDWLTEFWRQQGVAVLFYFFCCLFICFGECKQGSGHNLFIIYRDSYNCRKSVIFAIRNSIKLWLQLKTAVNCFWILRYTYDFQAQFFWKQI